MSHVVIIAYACTPNSGSEPGVGWNTLLGCLEMKYEVTLITKSNNVPKIMESLPPIFGPKLTIIPHDTFLIHIKKFLPFSIQIYYLFWILTLRRTILEIENRNRDCVFWHVNFATDWMPSISLFVSQAKVIWGPIGGTASTPKELRVYLGLKGKLKERFRDLLTGKFRYIFARKNFISSDLVLFLNRDEFKTFPKSSKIILTSNVFVPDSIPTRSAIGHYRANYEIICAGRIEPLKGFALAIEVLRYLPEDYTLKVVGEGSDKRRLINLARNYGLSERVRFLGTLSRDGLFKEIAKSDLFLQSSFHESCGWITAEALTIGIPVIGLPLGGTNQIADESGNRINLVEFPYSPMLIAKSILKLTEFNIPDPLNVWRESSRGNWCDLIIQACLTGQRLPELRRLGT